MKKAHLFLICWLAATVGTVSCEVERSRGDDTTHFIQMVTFADSLECRAVENESVIYLYFQGTSLSVAERNHFLRQIRDTKYNGPTSQDPSTTSVFANRFAAVDITSSEQFMDIPAGESLAKYVILRSATAMPYIESRYTIEGDWSDTILNEFNIGMGLEGSSYTWYPQFLTKCFHPIVKPLAELTQEDLFLLWRIYGTSIRFTAVPEVKSHVFTITVRDEDGGTLRCSVPFNFPGQ